MPSFIHPATEGDSLFLALCIHKQAATAYTQIHNSLPPIHSTLHERYMKENNIQMWSVLHPVSGKSGRNMKLISHCYLVPWLRTCGDLPERSTHAFILLCKGTTSGLIWIIS
jgi:hypothetical protein